MAALAQFAWAILGATLVGGTAGMLVRHATRIIQDRLIEAILTAAYGNDLVSDILRSSGILSTIATGLVLPNYRSSVHTSEKPESRF